MACLLPAANGRGGLVVLLLNAAWQTRGKLANVCGYLRLGSSLTRSCLVPPARMEKYHMLLTTRRSLG